MYIYIGNICPVGSPAILVRFRLFTGQTRPRRGNIPSTGPFFGRKNNRPSQMTDVSATVRLRRQFRGDIDSSPSLSKSETFVPVTSVAPSPPPNVANNPTTKPPRRGGGGKIVRYARLYRITGIFGLFFRKKKFIRWCTCWCGCLVNTRPTLAVATENVNNEYSGKSYRTSGTCKAITRKKMSTIGLSKPAKFKNSRYFSCTYTYTGR